MQRIKYRKEDNLDSYARAPWSNYYPRKQNTAVIAKCLRTPTARSQPQAPPPPPPPESCELPNVYICGLASQD